MDIDDFEEKVLKKIMSMSRKVVSDALNKEQRFQSWTSLQTIRGMAGGKYDWIIALVNSIFSSFQMFRNYEKIIGTVPFEQKTLIALKKLLESDKEMIFNLFITGIDDESTKNLRIVDLGGELSLPGTNEIKIIDKNTAINEQDIEEATLKLRAYFEYAFADKAEKLIKEAGR
jgi:hypothetical protein